MSSALKNLTVSGVSVWLDDLSRARLTETDSPSSLSNLIENFSVSGVTTNPSIFASAVKGSSLYRDSVRRHSDPEVAIRDLTCEDVQRACDLLQPIFESSQGVDGRVSIEVDPRSAYLTDATISEGYELWSAIDRPNLLIKVPATQSGLPAITSLISAGISVNVTLIFSLSQYRAVIEAYQEGIRDRQKKGLPLEGITSVASFFVSRMDTEIDKRLDALGTQEAKALRGRAALANARAAYSTFLQSFREFDGPIQRPLWASTGVKDPAYPDTLYVDELVAADCVNTMPEATLLAVADHGQVRENSALDTSGTQLFDELAQLGIDYDQVVELLEREGVTKFVDSWNDLIRTVTAAMG